MTSLATLETRKHTAAEKARGGAFAEAEALLTAVLIEAPRDLGALLLMGDVLHADNRARKASKYYSAFVRLAGATPPQALRGALQHAQKRLSDYEAEYARALDASAPPGGRSVRVQQSVDLMLGRHPVYLQQPRTYYFPGLPQIQFYDRAQFGWAHALETKTADIRRELIGVLQDRDALKPYLERSDTEPHLQDHRLVGNMDWSAFFLWKDGERIESNCEKCPLTAAAIEALPLDRLPGQAPSILFSVLKPGAHIPPHHGMINTRLICHLPLIVPGKAWLRVGSQTHHWKEGELVIFDDTIEHEARNEASETRIVLLFDIWRPEITPEEREDVVRLLTAVKDYTGEAVVEGT
jgi:aspartate beta-hydroxylase